jgi:hypothetical protein
VRFLACLPLLAALGCAHPAPVAAPTAPAVYPAAPTAYWTGIGTWGMALCSQQNQVSVLCWNWTGK